MTTRRFGTFEGVFTPCLLSILGVIMYLRLGWVVGNVGFGGALLIIGLANVITLATALSMSSVVTNIRIGTGGAYSIINKSLGVEIGGAIGIPLYLAQAISVAFYITGFTECWHFVFPEHNVLMVSLWAWLILLVISYLSAKLAFRIQYLIMTFVGLSIISILCGQGGVIRAVPLWPESFSVNHFWLVFAVFFPAVTGILAGTTMSGELIDPRKSIPVGTLAAIVVSLGLYVLLAFWFAKQVPVEVLRSHHSVAIDLGRWKGLVVVGIMGATISSALNMFVGSPRILLALGKHSILPFSTSLSHINKRGEPTTAILITALLALITILISSLNQIASLLTLFFLITYGMINFTVFIEQTMGIASFRPTFRVPRLIPFLGSFGCVMVMFLIDVKFSLVAILVIIGIYFLLIKRGLQVYSPDIRSGMLTFMAEHLARIASHLPYYPKAWKPNLVVPVSRISSLAQYLDFIRTIVSPAGRVTIFSITDSQSLKKDDQTQISEQLNAAVSPLRESGIFTETTIVQAPEISSGILTVIQALKGTFFPPNILFYALGESTENDAETNGIIEKASQEELGIIVLKYHPERKFDQEKEVNLWIRKQSPNLNLAILTTLQLEKNWEGTVRLVQVVEKKEEEQESYAYLKKLKELMRLPPDVCEHVMIGRFKEALKQAPEADINIFGMQDKPDIAMIRNVAQDIGTSVLFLRDSKHESALA